MSRKTKAEYIKVRRQRYEVESPARKSRIIDEVMDTTGFTRKYVINLLNGRIDGREVLALVAQTRKRTSNPVRAKSRPAQEFSERALFYKWKITRKS